jgi:hypothetical protein
MLSGLLFIQRGTAIIGMAKDNKSESADVIYYLKGKREGFKTIPNWIPQSF